jgi:hypothetical protein
MMRDRPAFRLKPEILKTSEIQERAEQLTLAYAEQVGLEVARLGINFQVVYEEVIYPDFGIELQEGLDLGFDDSGKKLFGRFLPMENIVQIDRIISDDPNHPQRAFTYWHEVGGHGVLQGDWLRKQLKLHGGSSCIATTEDSLSFDVISALERQANVYAARAGAPNWLLYHVVNETMDLSRPIRYIGPSKYTLQIQGRAETVNVKSFEHLCWIIGKQIQFRFGWLSAEALGYRIAETSMVKDFTNSPFKLNRVATGRRSIPIFAAPVAEILDRMVS